MAFNTDNTFVAMIDQNGFIRDISSGRRGEIIGVDYQKEEEYKQTISDMQETLDNYYNKLVELGAIEIPKSPEAIAQEAAAEQLRMAQEQAAQQAKINNALLEAIQGLKFEIGELKSNGRSGYDSEFGIEQNRSNSKSNGKIAKSSKVGASTGKENASGNNE